MQSQYRPSHDRSPCPVACTLDLIGDKWTLLVVRDMLLGRTQFKEFIASPEKIATNILSDRLAKLVEHGLAERQLSDEAAGRAIYKLTPKGLSLKPVIRAMANWGLEQIDGTEARLKAK
jgi:DNA-binding HxlR family transcriptional regulator